MVALVVIPLLLSQPAPAPLPQPAPASAGTLMPQTDDASETDTPQDEIGVTASGLLNIRFRDVELSAAMEMLNEQTGRNIILTNGVDGTVNAILRNITFEKAMNAILTANNLTYFERDGIIFITPPPQASDEAGVPHVMRIIRLNYISAQEAESFIKPLVTPQMTVTATSSASEGIKPDKESAGGMSRAGHDVLIVVGKEEAVALIERAIREIDVRPRQVLVEATIMRATLNEQNALGIDFNFLGGVDMQLLGATSPGVTNVTSLGNVPRSRLDDTSITLRTDFNDLIAGGGLTFGIIKEHVAGFIRALEQVTDVVVLANPKILTLNKQRGEIMVGRRDGYITTTTTETATVQTVEFLETGTKLVFRPFITGDGYVRFEIHPEDSNGGLTAANLPFQETTEVTTNVMLKDGHTILIGGLFRERTQVTKSRVPFISNIPWLEHLFGVDQNQTTREEVIILLTVHILEDNDVEDEMFEGLKEDIERIRVGLRRGLLGIGRERMAGAHYRWALEHLQAGRMEDALFDARMTLYINPRHMDAIRLNEQLLQQRNWGVEGSRMRTFVEDLLRKNAGLPPQPVLGRPDARAIIRDAMNRPPQPASPDEDKK